MEIWKAIRFRRGHKGGASMMGLVVLKEKPDLSFHHVRTQQEVCKPRRGSSPGTESAGILTLDLSVFRTMRNKYQLYTCIEVSCCTL